MYMQETELETELSTRESLKEKTPAQTQIEEIIALQPIVMFEKGACPFCAKAKAAFDEIGVKIATVDLENLNPSVAAEVQDHLETLTGARTVPRVFVNHKFIGGGTAVVELQEKGELLPLVEKAREAHTLDLEGKDYFSDTIDMTNEDWEEKLSPEAFRILRTRGTEYPNSHEYTQFYPTTGYFGCAACDLPLYSASSKFKSSCGWPVFNMCFHSDDLGCHILTRPDGSGALEIACPKCAGHLGHVFFDAFSAENPNGERH
jgi:peptide-methionine (R)-S-oxide reductase